MMEPYEKASHELDIAQASHSAAEPPAWLAAVALGYFGAEHLGWLSLPIIMAIVYISIMAPHKKRVRSAKEVAAKLYDAQFQVES